MESRIEFIATESGFRDGLGGASNSTTANNHYVLFGHQIDDQHPNNTGVYFEFDDQIHGAVDSVVSVTIRDDAVEFVLTDRKRIVVKCGVQPSEWSSFLQGIRRVFPTDVLQSGGGTKSRRR